MVPFVPFDAITSSSIRTAPGGRKVFFPWGAMGRGYAIASEHDYRRLQKQLTAQMVLGYLFSMPAVVLFANGYAPNFVALSIVFGLWLLFYLAWLRYWRPRLQPSDEKIEAMPPQAGLRFASTSQIFGLAWLGTGLVLFIFDPSSRPIPTLAVGIIIFGLGTVYYLLILRRRG